MARVTQDDVVIPEVFTETVQAVFAQKDAFTGSELASAGVVIVNDTLTERGGSKIGKYVNVPYFGTLGGGGRGQTDLFEFRACRNGNLHLRFRRMDLINALNRRAGGLRLRASQGAITGTG